MEAPGLNRSWAEPDPASAPGGLRLPARGRRLRTRV